MFPKILHGWASGFGKLGHWMNTSRTGLLALVVAAIFAATLSAQTRTVLRSITIVTEPNAGVWLDGVKYGTTGDDGRLKIAAGSGQKKIRVRADGFAEITKPLLPTQKGEIAIKLSKTTDDAELTFQEAERFSTVDRTKAIEAYRKAIRLKPKYIAAHIGLARALAEASDNEAALKAVADVRKIGPSAEASAIEGRVYRELGDEKKTVASFKRAIAEGKGFQPEAYAGLGLLYKEKAEGLGSDADDSQAKAAFSEAAKNLAIAVKQLAGAPDGIVIYQLLGLIYERQDRLKDAIIVYEEFLQVFPDSSESEAVRSFIVQLKKQISEQP